MSGTLEAVGRRALIVVPYAWLALFFLAPILLLLKISLSDAVPALPPYLPFFNRDIDPETGKQFLSIFASPENYMTLANDMRYMAAFLSSLKFAAISTVLAFLVGFPMAYAIARASDRLRHILLILVILPFWTSILIRAYAWIGILKPDGLLNLVLVSLGITDSPLSILNTDTAVYIGIVYTYLPFMVLPLYAGLARMDRNLIEAAIDLGCHPLRAFWTITVPVVRPGIAVGCLLVFIPAVGEFIIPSLLGGPDTPMIGHTLWVEVFNNRDWPLASAVALVMLALLFVPLALLRRQHVHAFELDR